MSIEIKVELTGLDVLKESLTEELVRRVNAAADQELYLFAEEVMADSKQVVPVDSGVLMSTGHVEQPEHEPDGSVSVRMGYGGPAAPYALAVHENLDPHVHWKRPGSGPKYLENPLKAKEPELSGRLVDRINLEMGK